MEQPWRSINLTDDLNLLILSYFKQCETKYDFSDLAQLLGVPVVHLLSRISELLKDGFLEYRSNLLSLSEAGRMALLNTGQDFLNFEGPQEIPLQRIHPEYALSLSEPYVPKDFDAKL